MVSSQGISVDPAKVEAPVLQPFRADRPCTLVMSDASTHGLGAVLMQAGTDGRLRPVAYHSRKLTAAERNYPTRGYLCANFRERFYDGT